MGLQLARADQGIIVGTRPRNTSKTARESMKIFPMADHVSGGHVESVFCPPPVDLLSDIPVLCNHFNKEKFIATDLGERHYLRMQIKALLAES